MEENRVILAYDIGSTYTKLSAFVLHKKQIQYAGRAQAPTTVDDVLHGIRNARYHLFEQEGQELGSVYEEYAASSAAGGLRMVAMGYMPRVTAKAAKEVAMNAGARVLEIISYEDPPEYKLEVLREIKPDIVLLAGGTDGGEEEALLENAQIIARSRIQSVVIIAGNVQAQARVQSLFEDQGIESVRVANVMPTIHELKVKPAREAIHEQFIRQITKARGLGQFAQTLTNQRVVPTPGAVLLGAELLALGTYANEGVGDLIVVDIGGATTDIHSILPSLAALPIEERGLIVTNEKQTSYRTVEGNLGLRISAAGILETVGPEAVLRKAEIEDLEAVERLKDYVRFLEKNPEHIAASLEEEAFDEGLAASAIEVALKRHAGYTAVEYDPLMGTAPGTPVGRDLRRVRTLIGVGGIFTHAAPERARRILAKAMENPGVSLLPKEPDCVIDQDYLLYAFGVLGEHYPEQVLQVAKKYIQEQKGAKPHETRKTITPKARG